MNRRRGNLDADTRPKVAVGYVRVSTKRQSEEGLSVEAQEERIKAWAILNGFTLLRMIGDAQSAKNADRAGFQEALTLACEQQAAFVVWKLDRFARSTEDALFLAKRLDAAGADLVSICEHIDTTNANGRFVFTMFAALATLERERIAERTQEVIDLKRERGEALGHTPYGFRATGRKVKGEDPPLLVPDEGEQVTLQAMLAHWDASHRYAYVARCLNREGLLSRAGTPWSAGQVRRILNRQSTSTAESNKGSAVQVS